MNLRDCKIGPLYNNLTSDELRLILSKEKEKTYKKREVIASPGDELPKVYILKDGQVEIYQLSREGKKLIIELVRPGGIFANAVFFEGGEGKFKDYVEALKDSTVCEILKEDFFTLLKQIPQLAINTINILGQKISEADTRLRDIALLDLKSRLKHELIHMARTIGFDKGDYYVFREKITHEDLGEIVGASREAVTKTLSQLK